MTFQTLTDPDAALSLRDALGDRIVLPAEPAYDSMRRAWNLAIDQRPFAVAHPTSAEDVVDIVRAAVAADLRVAPQSTGHGAAGLADTDLSRTVLVSLALLRGVTVNPAERTARVLGGSLWLDVLEAAAPHGLTALHGSAGDVSVAGYSLNGGLSFYARQHGMAVNAVRSITIVTADGVLRTASTTENPELFWAVRGGSGAFGVVVSLEIDLLPYAEIYAGMLLWDASHASEVGRAWREWTLTAPVSATTTFRVLHFPPVPELPPFLSGRSVTVIDGVVLESDEDAAALLAPLRALTPEMDTFGRMPAAGLVHVHMDPPEPSPALAAHTMLADLPVEALDAFVAAGSVPSPMMAEMRHLGGAAATRPEGAGAVGAVDAEYLVAGIGMVPVPEMAPTARMLTHSLMATMEPWAAPSRALTFMDGEVDRAPGFGESAQRLAELKRQYDPRDVFAAANPVA
ncbi:FAD-binding oxidoreductase [Microbacterium sediminicola]|uniref:FAD-binding oxidoreductase n=1 Tax=Microbacterium sediminicola TaxID=415210 RepID=A0ABN2HWP0_9MICO